MSVIPNDPVILLSFLNTRLRDQYDSLSALCDDLEQDETAIKISLSNSVFPERLPRCRRDLP